MNKVYLKGVEVKFAPGYKLRSVLSDELDVGNLTLPQTEDLNIKPMDEIYFEKYDKYMYVATVNRNTVQFIPTKLYDYQLQLVSRTIVLQRIVIPKRSIKQPIIGAKKTIYQIITRYLEIYAPHILISSALQTKLGDIVPELAWDKSTLFEVFNSLLSVVNCVVTIDNNFRLNYLDLNARGSQIDESTIIDEVQTQGIEDYTQALDVDVVNAISSEGKTKMVEYTTPRTNQFILTDDNLQVHLNKPIYEIEQVLVKTLVTVFDIPGGTSVQQLFDIDITDKVVVKEVYDSYLTSISTAVLFGNYKRNALYYSQENNIIDGLSFREGSFIPFVTTRDAITNILLSTLAEMSADDVNTDYQLDELNTRKYMFKVVYKANDTVRFQVAKNEAKQSELLSSQDEVYIDFESFYKKQKATLQRLGNRKLQIYGRDTTVPNLGDMYGNYVVIAKDVLDNIDEVVWECALSDNYVQANIFTALRMKKRFTQLAQRGEALLSHHLNYYRIKLTNAVVAGNDITDYFAGLNNNSINVCAIRTTGENSFASDFIGVELSRHIVDNTFFYSLEMQDNYNSQLRRSDDELGSDGRVSMQWTPYTDENGEFNNIEVYFYNKFTNPYSAVADYDDAIAISNSYPIVTNSMLYNDFAFSINKKRYKDNREITAETFQFEFVGNNDNIFITENTYKILPNYEGELGSLFLYVSPTETYSENNLSRKGSVNKLLYGSSWTVSHGNNWFNLLVPSYAVSWCIASASGDVYLAVNGNNGKIYLELEEVK